MSHSNFDDAKSLLLSLCQNLGAYQEAVTSDGKFLYLLAMKQLQSTVDVANFRAQQDTDKLVVDSRVQASKKAVFPVDPITTNNVIAIAQQNKAI
jgi:hypothetical protein